MKNVSVCDDQQVLAQDCIQWLSSQFSQEGVCLFWKIYNVRNVAMCQKLHQTPQSVCYKDFESNLFQHFTLVSIERKTSQ